MSQQDQIGMFGDLPQALVSEMLGKSEELAGGMVRDIARIQKERESLRGRLEGRIRIDSDIVRTPRFPTAAGVDGSYCTDSLLATDFVAMAAVAVEGLVPRTRDEPIWPKPRHFVSVERLAHDENTQTLAKAIMMSMETQLASLAPHDVVMLDGSLTTITIAYNIAFKHKRPKRLADWLRYGDRGERAGGAERFGPLETTLENYRDILEGRMTDRVVVAVPKYSRRNEICKDIGMTDFDDKGMLSLILSPGEYTEPVQIEKEEGGMWLTAKLPKEVVDTVRSIEDALSEAHVTYYKPRKDFPAVRLEVGKSVAKSEARLASLLEAVRTQSGVPGMMEPYPVFLADKMVKHLPKALPIMKDNAVLRTAAEWSGDISDVILATRGYRT